MNIVKIIALVAVAGGVAGCEGGGKVINGDGSDKTVDFGFDNKHLSQLKAGIWIDPNGCDHWIVDDGLEGYLSPRVTPDGKPVCSGSGKPGFAYGDYKGGSTFQDPI